MIETLFTSHPALQFHTRQSTFQQVEDAKQLL